VICGLVKDPSGSPGLTNQKIPDLIGKMLEAALSNSRPIL